MLTLLAGPPGAGKSTVAAQAPGRVIEFDDWVVERFGGTFNEAQAAYCRAYPDSYREFMDYVIKAAHEDDVVLVDPYVRREDRLRLLEVLRGAGIAPLNLLYLAVGWGMFWHRNETRPVPRGEEICTQLYDAQEFPLPDEGWDSVHIIGAG